MVRPREFDESEVLDRAMEVFWRQGYEGTSMADLSLAMGLSAPSIYAAFGSKRGLFDAVLARYREWRSAHREQVLSAATAREVAERMLYGAIDWLVDPKEPRGCLLFQAAQSAGSDNAEIPQVVSRQRQKTLELLAERLSRAQAEGDLPPSESPRAVARYLVTIFAGLAIQAADGASKAQLREAAARALKGIGF